MRALILALLLPGPAFACAMYVPPEVVAQRQEAQKKQANAQAAAANPQSATQTAEIARTLESLMQEIDASASILAGPPVAPAPTVIAEAQPHS